MLPTVNLCPNNVQGPEAPQGASPGEVDLLVGGQLETILPDQAPPAVPLNMLIVPERTSIARVGLLPELLAETMLRAPGIDGRRRALSRDAHRGGAERRLLEPLIGTGRRSSSASPQAHADARLWRPRRSIRRPRFGGRLRHGQLGFFCFRVNSVGSMEPRSRTIRLSG